MGVFGHTAVLTAAAHGHVDIIQYLHSLGADLNSETITGETMAILAARNGHPGVLEVSCHPATGGISYVYNSYPWYSAGAHDQHDVTKMSPFSPPATCTLDFVSDRECLSYLRQQSFSTRRELM